MSMCLDDVCRCISHTDKEQLSTSAQEHLSGKSKVTMVYQRNAILYRIEDRI